MPTDEAAQMSCNRHNQERSMAVSVEKGCHDRSKSDTRVGFGRACRALA
jgi:hypothetical protein